MQTKIRGERGGGSGEAVDVKATRGGSLHVAQMLPPGALLTAMGESYTAITTTAVAALADEPTTAALFTLYNGEAGGGKSYIIDRIFAYQDVSAAAESRWALWAIVQPVATTAVAADISLINNQRGVSNYGGNAKLGVGDTVVDKGWSPWSNSLDVEATGALGGAACSVNVAGRMVVPPTGACSLHVVASSVDEDFCVGFHWHEVQLDLA